MIFLDKILPISSYRLEVGASSRLAKVHFLKALSFIVNCFVECTPSMRIVRKYSHTSRQFQFLFPIICLVCTGPLRTARARRDRAYSTGQKNASKGHLEATWRPLGGHLEATWRPLGGHLAATWRPLGGHLAATWRPLGGHLAATWRPLGGHLEATWTYAADVTALSYI